jgi:hypothetical protein
VVAVGTPPCDVQKQVQFGGRGDVKQRIHLD